MVEKWGRCQISPEFEFSTVYTKPVSRATVGERCLATIVCLSFYRPCISILHFLWKKILSGRHGGVNAQNFVDVECRPMSKKVPIENSDSFTTVALYKSMYSLTYLLSTHFSCRHLLQIKLLRPGQFTFWISLSLRPKTETKRLNFGLSPELRLTNRCSASSTTHRWFRRISSFIFELAKNEVIFTHQNLTCVDAKSTGDLISFGFSDRLFRSLAPTPN